MLTLVSRHRLTIYIGLRNQGISGSRDCSEKTTKSAKRIWGLKKASDLPSRPQGDEPDRRKWRCFSRTQHNQSCGILHLSRSGCWCVKHSTSTACEPVHTSTNPVWCFVIYLFIFLINLAFCLCEAVKIRLVFHSKYGLYKYTDTLRETHWQLGAHSHKRSAHSGIDSAAYVWGQFILPQVVPDWIWSESHYASPWLTLRCPPPPTLTRIWMHAYTCTCAHRPKHTKH